MRPERQGLAKSELLVRKSGDLLESQLTQCQQTGPVSSQAGAVFVVSVGGGVWGGGRFSRKSAWAGDRGGLGQFQQEQLT